MKTGLFIALLLMCMMFVSVQKVRADDCKTVWVPDPPPNGSFRTVCAGGSGGGEETPPSRSCIPGTTIVVSEYAPNPADPSVCHLVEMLIDVCTGEILWADVDYDQSLPCQLTADETDSNPCTVIEVRGDGIHCISRWYVEAQVGFPEAFLDARPYPATLVRWPTGVRCGGQSLASDSGTLDYVAYGGGSEGNPSVGDWRDLSLTLRLEPAGPLFLTLPHVGSLALPDVGASGQPVSFQWEVSSHPAVGGGILAGNVSNLDGLPPDIPLFEGRAQSPYRLFWRLTYEEYDSHR